MSESGFFLVKVNVIKQTTYTFFACVDYGFNHFIRPMFYDSSHHIDNISNPLGKLRFYTVVGYICESDTFCVNRQINEIREGVLEMQELIVFLCHLTIILVISLLKFFFIRNKILL